MLILEVPYGQATALRIGRLRAQATGLFIAAPTIAVGDFKITQDDGVGEDNVDNIPTVDTGTGDLLWTISAAEATTPSANGAFRVMHAADAAGAEWLDRDILVVTTDHPLAAKPNGIIYGGALDTPATDIAAGGTTMTLPATPASWEAPSSDDVIKGWWCEVFDENDVHAGGYVQAYNATTRVLTFDANCPLRVDFTGSTTVDYRLYPDNRRIAEDLLRIAGTSQTAGNATAGIASILEDTGTDGVVVAAASKTGYSLTAATGLGNQTADITGSLSGSVGSVTGAVGSVTGAVGSIGAGGIVAATFGAGAIDAAAIAADAIGSSELAATAVQKILTSAMTEAYSTDGSTLTVAQALYEVVALLSEFAISGTTLTVKKRDGSTTALTLTLSDATNPTSVTRAS